MKTISIAEAAERTGFSRDALRRLLLAKKIAYLRLNEGSNSHYRIVLASLEQFMAEHTVEPKGREPRVSRDADHDLPPVSKATREALLS